MSSSLRRGALAASALAFSVAALSACGAGNNSQTLEIQPDSAATSVGTIKVQNATVITQPDLTSTGPAVVTATIFNTGTEPETLQSIVVAGTGKTAELHATKSQPLTIQGGGRLILGGTGNASAVLASSREAITDGNAQKITFTFSKTGDVSLRAFVVPAESYFTGWGPSAVPSASPSTSTTPLAGSTASESAKAGKKNNASESASATPTDSASASTNAG
ncbi:DUF461 domain-containing protein [Streptomyces fuscichromogenes]|uniref:Lipoprotein n=1 Tax=Streptomyces fuscichromogenes TaxID=1324013 RepID=A0A917XHL5_9ACTN|nr:DUF461 domain-containing protein [Streptomyces fuscichromogenes]GGN26132.1 lipoprotein [Streptomyces fuscichromogenes]